MITDRIASPKSKLQQSLPVAFSWFAVLLASALPIIIFRQFSDNTSASLWIGCIQAGCLLLLITSTFMWSTIKGLRGFFIALMVIVLGWNIVIPFVLDSDMWSNVSNTLPAGLALIVLNLIRLFPLPLMLLSLIGSNTKRQDLFLVRGNVKARSQFQFLGKQWAISWILIGIIFLLVAGLVLPAYLSLTMQPSLSMLTRAVVNLPFIIIAAIMNSFNEEFEFRSVLLARLIPHVGRGQAIWLSTFLFGLAHFYGQPSGVVGVGLAGIAGLLWASSMLETRGIAWAWITHFVQDAVIFSFLIMYF
jgi:membrane protease YdiL (CAAX protease family)